MPHFPIYLDYSATTPVDPRVDEKMVPYLTEFFGNPASRSHSFGWDAENAVENARKQVASLVQCDPKAIVWTSGATESNNLALKGIANFHSTKGKHLITVKTEHKATLDTMRELERQGFSVTYLTPLESGLVDLEVFKAAIQPDTILASVMFVNNEIGVIQDIESMGNICREKGVVFHVDAAQATGKVEIDLGSLPVDLMSFSAHKTYGPKGIGALYVSRKPKIRLDAQMHGGGHERGFRSGTLPTHQIVGMGESFQIANSEMGHEIHRIRALRDRLWSGISDMEEIYLNGDVNHRVPHILNVSLEPSHVLRAIGREDELAHSSIRFSIGRYTTEADIDHAVKIIREKVDHLRNLSPLWDMFKSGIDLSTVSWVHGTESHRNPEPASL